MTTTRKRESYADRCRRLGITQREWYGNTDTAPDSKPIAATEWRALRLGLAELGYDFHSGTTYHDYASFAAEGIEFEDEYNVSQRLNDVYLAVVDFMRSRKWWRVSFATHRVDGRIMFTCFRRKVLTNGRQP